MKNEFEKQLADALRPVEPSDEFAERVMLQVKSRSSEDKPQTRSLHSARQRWFPAALVASLVLGVALSIVFTHEWQERREREGLEARKQLIEALRVTGEKLDLAYRVVNSKSGVPTSDVKSGDNGA